MARRSRYVTSEVVRLGKVTALFETWLKGEGYRASPPLSNAGIEAIDLIEDFLNDADDPVGKKELLQLRRHARLIGLVVNGSDFSEIDMREGDDQPEDED